MKLLNFKPQSAIIEIELDSSEELIQIWMAVQHYKEAHPEASQYWQDMMKNISGKLYEIVEKFD